MVFFSLLPYTTIFDAIPCDNTWRDFAARRSKLMTQLESTGMTQQQTSVKEWE